MKKALVTVLLAAGFVLAGQVSASAQAVPTSNDTDGYAGVIIAYMHPTMTNIIQLDNAADGIPDIEQYALFCAILADGSSPFHDSALAIWNHNFAAAMQDMIPALPATDGQTYPFRAGLVMLMTMGSAGDFTDAFSLLAILQAGGFPVNPATLNLANYQQFTGVLPGAADPDGDDLTNKAEYDAIAGVGGPASAKRAQWIADVQSAGDVFLTATASGAGYRHEAGTNVTLQVAVSGGTEPYFYQWMKNDVNISGADAATLAFEPLELSDAGDYTVRVRDSEGGVVDSNVVTLNVVAEGALPVAGIVAVGLLAAACAGLGVRKAIKK